MFVLHRVSFIVDGPSENNGFSLGDSWIKFKELMLNAVALNAILDVDEFLGISTGPMRFLVMIQLRCDIEG